MLELKVLSTPDCPPCEVVMRIAQKLQGEFPDLSIEKIDMIEHPEVSVQYRIFSAPGVVINGKLEFVGAPKEKQLREKLRQIVTSAGA